MFTSYLDATKVGLSSGSRKHFIKSAFYGGYWELITESKWEYRGMTEAAAKAGEVILNGISGNTALAERATGPMWKISLSQTVHSDWVAT